MAIDTLQIPTTVINNDKLVSMYGNLLAKKKAEEDSYQKNLIDQMAKIDATGIKREDVDDYSKLYKEYVDFGSSNLRNLSDPSVQVRLKQMENQLRGFITLSKANKEEDLKLVSYMGPDYNEDTRKSAQQFIATPTLKRTGAFDYTKIGKVDTKDYINEIASSIDPKVIITQGNLKMVNPEAAYPKIQSLIEGNVRAQGNTLTGAKALAQFAVNAGIDLTTPEGREKAIKGLSKSLFEIKKASLDKAISEFGTQSKETETEQISRLGYNKKLIPSMQLVTEIADKLRVGDTKTIDKLKQMSLGGLQFEDGQYDIKVYKKNDDSAINKMSNKNDDGMMLIQRLSKNQSPNDFAEQVVSFLNQFGSDAGIKSIELGQYRSFLNSKDRKDYTPSKGTFKSPMDVRVNKTAPRGTSSSGQTKKVKNTRGI